MSFSPESCKLRAHIQLPMLCNMDPPCPYCGTRTVWGGFQHGLSLDEGQRWHSALSDFSEKFGPVYYTVLWGEPTADDTLITIFGRRTRDSFVEFVSNVIRPPSEWVRKIDDLQSFGIVASYHPHHWATTDQFCDRLDEMRDLGISVSMVFIVAYPPNFHQAVRHRDEIAQRGWSVALMPYGGDLSGCNYPRDYEGQMWSTLAMDLQRVWGRSDLIRGTDSSPRGVRCRVGMDYVWIDSAGDAMSCYAEASAVKLGNVFERNVSLLTRPTVCRSPHCRCPDMYVYMTRGE